MSTACTWYWLFKAPTVLSKTQRSERELLRPFLIAGAREMHVWLLLQLSYNIQALPQISPFLSDKAKNCKNEK